MLAPPTPLHSRQPPHSSKLVHPADSITATLFPKLADYFSEFASLLVVGQFESALKGHGFSRAANGQK
jgi:hypothetical protein